VVEIIYRQSKNKKRGRDIMSKVMIQPATYENVKPAIDRAFELFPINIKGNK